MVKQKPIVLLIENVSCLKPILINQEWLIVNAVSPGKVPPKQKFDLVIFNAMVLRSSGTRLVNKAYQIAGGKPLIIVARKDQNIPANHHDDLLIEPHSTTLVRHTRRWLGNHEVKRLDGLCLHLPGGWVEQQDGMRTLLNPTLTRMLSELMRNAGEVVEHKKLFNRVWDTDYTDDMRTMVTHINLLRKAIEKNPSNPKRLITVRGKGYKLKKSTRYD